MIKIKTTTIKTTTIIKTTMIKIKTTTLITTTSHDHLPGSIAQQTQYCFSVILWYQIIVC